MAPVVVMILQVKNIWNIFNQLHVSHRYHEQCLFVTVLPKTNLEYKKWNNHATESTSVNELVNITSIFLQPAHARIQEVL